MGAEQSKTESNDGGQPVVADYYSILAISESADQDQIKASHAPPLDTSPYTQTQDRKPSANKPSSTTPIKMPTMSKRPPHVSLPSNRLMKCVVVALLDIRPDLSASRC